MSVNEVYLNNLSEQIIGSAYTIANSLGYGFLEKVYENALAHELKKLGLKVSCQEPIKVLYDGIVVGDYYADILVDDEVVVELKSTKAIDNPHIAQCLNYLKSTGKKLGLLINFGPEKVQIKRIVNNF